MKNLLMVADSYSQSSADNKVKLLTAVGGGVDRLVLKVCIVFVSYPVGLGKLVSEICGKVLNLNSVFACRNLSLSSPCDRVGGKNCAVSLKKVGNTNVKCKGALMNECERKINRSAFIYSVLINRNLCLFRHFLNGKSTDISHFMDTFCHFIKLF